MGGGAKTQNTWVQYADTFATPFDCDALGGCTIVYEVYQSSSVTTYLWDFFIDDLSAWVDYGTNPFLTPPTLLSPEDESTENTAAPVFDWTDSAAATAYDIEIDDNDDFSSPTIEASPASSTYTASGLAEDVYYWRVRATNSLGESAWTTAWSFTVALPPGSAGFGTRPVHTTATLTDPADPAGGDTIVITEDFANVYAVGNGTIESISLLPTGYRAVINLDNGNVATYNGLNTVYAEAGETVGEGCLLGETGYSTQRKTKADGTVSNQIDFEWLDDASEPVDWTGFDDPDSSAACGVQQRTENCINNNPNLNNKGSGYKLKLASSDQLKTEGVITLMEGDYITQDLTGLTAEATYYITVAGKTKYPAVLTVGITGNTPVDIGITEAGDFQDEIEYIPTQATGIPDVWQLYVEATKVKAEGIHLDFVCLHTETIATAPRDCYFPDQMFQKTDVWTLTGSAELIEWDWTDPLSAGYMRLPLNGQIADDINLTSEADQSWEYVLTVWAKLAPIGSVTDLVNSGDDGTLSARVDTGAGDETIGDLTISRYGVFYAEKLAFTVPAGETWAGNFELELTALDAAPDYVEINQICLNPKVGYWPGQHDRETTTPVNEGCVACTIPSGLNVWEWLAWLGCLIRNLWYCAIAPEVAKIVSGLFDVVYTLESAVIWGLAALTNIGNFFWKTAVWQGKRVGDLFAFVGSDLWLKLIGKDFFKQIVDWLTLSKLIYAAAKDLLDAIASLPGFAFKTFASLIKSIYTIWGNFKTGINAGTHADLGLPDCSSFSDSDPLAPVCWGFNHVDKALWETPALYTIFLTGEIALLAVLFLLWLFNRIKREIPFLNAPKAEDS